MKPPQNMLAHATDAPAFVQEKTYINIIAKTLEESAKWAECHRFGTCTIHQ